MPIVPVMDVSGVAVFAAFSLFLAGLVKGVVGLGLPLVALPLLTMAIGLKPAVGLLVVPIFTSNLVQSFQGGQFVPTLRRFWPVFLPLIGFSMFSTQALVILPERYLAGFIGVAVISFPSITHFQPRVRISPKQERWIGALAGTVAGILGGATTFYGPPLMLFLAGLRLPKDGFVAAVSLLFLMGSIGLSAGLLSFGITAAGELPLSAAAALPVFVGLLAGQQVRRRLDERRFANLLLLVYLASGASFLLKAVL